MNRTFNTQLLRHCELLDEVSTITQCHYFVQKTVKCINRHFNPKNAQSVITKYFEKTFIDNKKHAFDDLISPASAVVPSLTVEGDISELWHTLKKVGNLGRIHYPSYFKNK